MVRNISDEHVVHAVAELGGSERVTKKGLWTMVAQRLGLKGIRGAEIQDRFLKIVESFMEADTEDEDDCDEDDSHGGGGGPGQPGDAVEDVDDASEREDEVEAIVGEGVRRGMREYLVKWQGTEETTWEPEKHLRNCPEKVREFKARKAAAAAAAASAAVDRDKGAAPAATKAAIRADEGEAGATEAPRLVQDVGRVRARDHDDESHRDLRPSKAARVRAGRVTNEDGRVLSGLLSNDTIASVEGPTSVEFQWLVLWRSGNRSQVSNSQLKQEAPERLFEWYEKAVIFERDDKGEGGAEVDVGDGGGDPGPGENPEEREAEEEGEVMEEMEEEMVGNGED